MRKSQRSVYGDSIMASTGARHAGEFDLDRLLFETNICHQSIFYRRELFAGIGPFNLRYPVWADWDFNIRCFSNPALTTRYMDIVISRYNDLTGLSTGRAPTLSFESVYRDSSGQPRLRPVAASRRPSPKRTASWHCACS